MSDDKGSFVSSVEKWVQLDGACVDMEFCLHCHHVAQE